MCKAHRPALTTKFPLTSLVTDVRRRPMEHDEEPHSQTFHKHQSRYGIETSNTKFFHKAAMSFFSFFICKLGNLLFRLNHEYDILSYFFVN